MEIRTLIMVKLKIEKFDETVKLSKTWKWVLTNWNSMPGAWDSKAMFRNVLNKNLHIITE